MRRRGWHRQRPPPPDLLHYYGYWRIRLGLPLTEESPTSSKQPQIDMQTKSDNSCYCHCRQQTTKQRAERAPGDRRRRLQPPQIACERCQTTKKCCSQQQQPPRQSNRLAEQKTTKQRAERAAPADRSGGLTSSDSERETSDIRSPRSAAASSSNLLDSPIILRNKSLTSAFTTSKSNVRFIKTGFVFELLLLLLL